MAAKKVVEEFENVKKVDDDVIVNLPRAGREEKNFVFVSVNGKNYKVMKGVPVKVPRSVAQVLLNSDIAKNEADSFIESVIH